MMDLKCWGVHFTLWEWFRSCALLAFIQPEISIKILEEDWRPLWLQNVRLSLAPCLIMLMDVQYIHPPVSLASSCYQGILKIDLDMISYSHATLCLRTSSQAALGNRIHGLSCGEVVISLSGNGSASVHYCFFFDAYDSGNVTKRLCWRCWRLAVWGCIYAPVLVPSKSLYWGICRRHLVSFLIAIFYKIVARNLWSIPVHGWSDIFRGLRTLSMILCTFSQTPSPIAMI